MRESLLIAYFVLTIMPSQQQKDLLTTPIVGIELRDGGYHRDLIYTVQFDYPLAGKNCEYILQQSLPASVYISVDQLDDLVRKKKLDAIYPGYVDIEKPTEESSDFEIFIKGSTKVSDTVTLPIHFRYHAPNDENSFIPVDLIAPAAMYIKCPIPEEQDLVERKLEIESNTIYCLDESVPAIREYIKRDINVRSSEIPIGNVSAHPTVLYLTIIISWAVSLWTIFRTRHIPILINEKLDEQRLLQRKIK